MGPSQIIQIFVETEAGGEWPSSVWALDHSGSIWRRTGSAELRDCAWTLIAFSPPEIEQIQYNRERERRARMESNKEQQ